MPKHNDWRGIPARESLFSRAEKGKAGKAGKAGRAGKAGLLLLLLLAAGAYWLFGYEPAYSGTLVAKPARTLVFAHRGFGNLAPDNSLYAVEQAMAAGMDGVDVDGQFTADSELVVFHDLSVDRLTSDTGRVTGKTLREMQALDLGPRFDPALTGAYVHTFEDFVLATRGKGILMVELKVPSAKRSGIEDRAVAIIQKHGAQADVVLSSFNPLVLWRIKKLDPSIRTALIFMDTNWNPELVAEIKKGDEVDLPWPLRQEWIRRGIRKLVKPDLLSVNVAVDRRVRERLIAKGWPVFLWTPDAADDIQAALNQRPYGVISNEPVRAKELRGQ
jgi:glycerophosphoryl diester phosphodiesterase